MDKRQVSVTPFRPWGQDIWSVLPLQEQRRLIRHLRPFWDTHRFRIAPQVGALLDRRTVDGALTISAASVQQADMKDGRFAIALRDRAGNTVTHIFDAVIATTGPGHSRILDGQPFLAGLVKKGLVMPDPTGLGLAVDTRASCGKVGTGFPQKTMRQQTIRARDLRQI